MLKTLRRHPALRRVTRATQGIPNMTPHQGALIFDHLVSTGAQRGLEIGTARGVGAAYMAAAMEVTDGTVTTIDTERADYQPAPADTLARAGVAERVELVRVPDSDYNWWLSEQVKGGTPAFDFCYLDGAHNFTIDGLAVVLIEKLLKPGGWLLLDDVHWTYRTGTSPRMDKSRFSEAELTEPHVLRIVATVMEGRGYTRPRIDGDWAWAQKC